MKKPKLFVTLGAPGSGKTYFSERFAKSINAVHLNSDKIRIEVIENPKYIPSEHKVLFKVIDYLAEQFLSQGLSVVYDANMTKREYRKRVYNIAKKQKADHLLIYISTPLEVAINRAGNRTGKAKGDKKKYYRDITPSIVHKLNNAIEQPLKSEAHVVIPGNVPYAKQFSQIKSLL